MIIHSPKDLARYTRDKRKQLQLSQTEASQRVGLKQTTLSALENKPGGTKLATLFRILSALNLELHLIPKDSNETVKNNTQWSEEW